MTHTEKISLQAKIATLEKELKEVKKSNNVLKNKVCFLHSVVFCHCNILVFFLNPCVNFVIVKNFIPFEILQSG